MSIPLTRPLRQPRRPHLGRANPALHRAGGGLSPVHRQSAGREKEPRHNQLDEMVPECSKFMKPMQSEMQPPAQRIWKRLSFIVIIQAGEVAPARIAANLDERVRGLVKKDPGVASSRSTRAPVKDPVERRGRSDCHPRVVTIGTDVLSRAEEVAGVHRVGPRASERPRGGELLRLHR